LWVPPEKHGERRRAAIGREAGDSEPVDPGPYVVVTMLFSKEAGPSIKRTKTSDDSGLDMDNAAENGGGDSVIEGGASEIELVFRPHPTLMEKDDGHNRYNRSCTRTPA